MSAPVLGIDISKQKLDVALFKESKIKHKSFKNTAEGFEALSLWLKKSGIKKVHACLEATGNYGEELAIYLHEAGHMVSVVNPARIKGFAQSELIRTKTDSIDAGIIARFCLAMKPDKWEPPSAEIRRLRAMVRRVDSLNDMLTQEKNRLGTAHESVIPLIEEHLNYLDQEIEKVGSQIADLIDRDPDLRKKEDLLAYIPGISKATIASLKGKPRLCKTGHARLRKALFMPALVSIRYNPVMISFYNRLKDKGKNGKVIVCAIMRKLVHVIFGVLKSGKMYDPNYKPINA